MSKSEIQDNKAYRARFSQAWGPPKERSREKFDCDRVTSKMLHKRNTLNAQKSMKNEADGRRGSNFGMSEEGCQFLRRIEICKENQ